MYKVVMDVLPGKSGDLPAHREFDDLTEEAAKELVNGYAQLVLMKRIVVYLDGVQVKGWLWKSGRFVEMHAKGAMR